METRRMSNFKIGDRVRLNPLHHYGYRANIAGRYGVIKFNIDHEEEIGVMINSCGLCFVHKDSVMPATPDKPELSNWSDLTDKNGNLFYVPKAEA